MKKIRSIVLTLTFILIIAACDSSENKIEETKNDSQTTKDHEHQIKSAENGSSELVREGIINVESLDANNDGNLYECPMDWNVLSDHDGDCPVCGMQLKEFTVNEVKEDLDKYGYEYKK